MQEVVQDCGPSSDREAEKPGPALQKNNASDTLSLTSGDQPCVEGVAMDTHQ